MKSLRHLLCALALLLAQTGALTHAAEHLRPDADAPANHACALCIATHALDVALASTPPAIVLPAADFAPPAGAIVAAFSPAAVSPRARAPPAA